MSEEAKEFIPRLNFEEGDILSDCAVHVDIDEKFSNWKVLAAHFNHPFFGRRTIATMIIRGSRTDVHQFFWDQIELFGGKINPKYFVQDEDGGKVRILEFEF